MRRLIILALTAATAVVIMSALTGAAAANRLAVNAQNFSIAWNDLDFQGGTIQCDVTLVGSFHSRTITKTQGLLIGHITGATVQNCNFGISVRILAETLPWHVTYQGFTGDLPNIEDVTVLLVGAAFLLDIFFGAERCLYQSTAEQPAAGIIPIGAGGEARTLIADPGPQIPLLRDLNEDGEDTGADSDCPPEGEFSGTGTVTPNTLTVTLV